MRRVPATFSALSEPSYRRFLPAQLIGSTGVWMQRIAQDWLVLELTGSAAAVGLVVAMQFAPMLLLGLWGGVVVDRFPKRALLVITQAVAASLALLLGVLALTGVVQAWHVYAIALTLGVVVVVDGPARQAFVSELVPPSQIRNAVSLNSTAFQFSGVVGPALSGLLVTAVGQGWSFIVNGLACSAVAAIIFSLKPRFVMPAPQRTKGALRQGLAYIVRTSEVFWAIALVALAGLFAFNLPVLLATMADTEFGTGVSGYSLLTTVNAVGALIGGIWSARRSATARLRSLTGGLGALGLIFAVMAAVEQQWAFSLLLVACGIATMTFLIGANSMIQLTCTPEVRGRVMSVYTMALLGGQAVAGPLVGRFSDALGPRAALVLCGLSILVVTALLAVMMARQAHLRLALHRGHWTPKLHIVRVP
ncbi:MFS transporter [Auraticoccus cholistanensis]|uniref:MFS transporter n=1 Tax=Auraticoccus cholistanensis TaxID=2656650 RepID=UPI002F91103C